MNNNRIRLTESQLHRVIKECVRNILAENNYKENNGLAEGFGNWLRAGIDGITNMGAYSQGASNSKVCNFTDNVRRAKQNYDDLDTIQNASKYGCQNAPKAQMAQARRSIYTEPGSNRQVSDNRRFQAYQTMVNARKRQQDIDSRRRMRQYDQNNGTNLYNQRYGH